MAYELFYSPLISGSFEGSISFLNDVVGELWYKVFMKATPAPPIIIDTIECMLGNVQSIQVPLENPLSEQVTLVAKLSNSENFTVRPENITLEPYSQTSFDVVFRPSGLGDYVESSILFHHHKFGEMLFLVSGTGLLPGVMPTVNVSSEVNEMGSHSISFRNPFPYPLPVDIILKNPAIEASQSSDSSPPATEPERFVFSLFLRKSSGLVLPANSSLQIGIGFTPDRLNAYTALLEVRSSAQGRNLLWLFPICGTAEVGPSQRLPKLLTPCKTSLLREIEFPLEGLKIVDLGQLKVSPSDFSVEIKILEQKYKNIITRAFRVQVLDVIISEGIKNYDFVLRCRLLFEPLKSFASQVEICVIGKNIGKWRSEIDLEATDPTPDDIINLSAPVGGTDKVSFRLSNRFLGYSTYHSYFSGKSSSQFSIYPATGVLAPFGSEGTPFTIAFTPTEYGLPTR